MTSATISSCTQSWILSLAHFSSDSQATLDELRRLVVFSFMAVSPSVGCAFYLFIRAPRT